MLWWLSAVRWDSLTGQPGNPEWPRDGGILRQPGKLADAHELLLAEWPHVQQHKAPAKPEAAAEDSRPEAVPGKARRRASRARQ